MTNDNKKPKIPPALLPSTVEPAELARIGSDFIEKAKALADPIIARVDDAITSHEAIAVELRLARHVRLVAMASENGRLSEEQAKERLERMINLLPLCEELESLAFPLDDADDDEPDEDPVLRRL